MAVSITTGDHPKKDGMYVAYVDPDVDVPFAQKKFLIWSKGQWGHCGSDQNFRGAVYGFIGPLPALKLEYI